MTDHVFKNRTDFSFVQERSFAIDLCKFGLTISAQIFVAKAFGDLVVAIKTRHHQHLFKQLWRLRQGKELASVHA